MTYYKKQISLFSLEEPFTEISQRGTVIIYLADSTGSFCGTRPFIHVDKTRGDGGESSRKFYTRLLNR